MTNPARPAFIPWCNTPERYGAVAQLLHWIIVALVITQFVLGFSAQGLPIGIERFMLLVQHKSIGMTVFGLALLRLAWRAYTPAPALPAGMPASQRLVAHLSHGLLYALILVIPVVGWITSSASHLTVTWFGLFAFPNLVGPDLHLARLAKNVHAAVAWTLLVVASLHALAALWHHFRLKDTVLLRMLPVRLPRTEERP